MTLLSVIQLSGGLITISSDSIIHDPIERWLLYCKKNTKPWNDGKNWFTSNKETVSFFEVTKPSVTSRGPGHSSTSKCLFLSFFLLSWNSFISSKTGFYSSNGYFYPQGPSKLARFLPWKITSTFPDEHFDAISRFLWILFRQISLLHGITMQFIAV